jgi:hypothetical protein
MVEDLEEQSSRGLDLQRYLGWSAAVTCSF